MACANRPSKWCDETTIFSLLFEHIRFSIKLFVCSFNTPYLHCMLLSLSLYWSLSRHNFSSSLLPWCTKCQLSWIIVHDMCTLHAVKQYSNNFIYFKCTIPTELYSQWHYCKDDYGCHFRCDSWRCCKLVIITITNHDDGQQQSFLK